MPNYPQFLRLPVLGIIRHKACLTTEQSCFVIYAPKVISPALDKQAVIIVDDLLKQSLIGEDPRIIADDLDLSKPHQVKVTMQDQTWYSERFKFKPGITMMNLWRSAGYWHLEPNASGACAPLSKESMRQSET